MKHVAKQGFTVIEMLMVIAIIGILAVIGLAQLNGTRESARDAVRMADLSQIRLGLALYFDDHNSYPAPVAADGAGPDLSTTENAGTIFSQAGNPLFPGYVGNIPVDPLNSYAYAHYYYYDTNENPEVGNRNYVFCFHEEGKSRNWFYIYSTGVYGEGDHCPLLPQT